MDTSRYAELFLTESQEHLSAINHALLELERAPDSSEPVNALFRAVHTIKGMSATMGYVAVAELAHELETLLDQLRRGSRPVTPEVTDALFTAADSLEVAVGLSVAGRPEEIDVAGPLERLRSLDGGARPRQTAPVPAAAIAMDWQAPAPPGTGAVVRDVSIDGSDGPAAGAPAPPRGGGDGASPRGARSVRIDLRRLDNLMNLIGELVITRGRLTQLAAGLENPALDEAVAQASRLITDLQDEIMTSRMVPVWQVFDRFPRLVRDAARTLGKQIDFTIAGKEIELDRSMLDEIGDPVVHLLRNAIDHGIETPEDRRAADKPPAGRLSLEAMRDRSAIVIRVADDGRGIDRERVLRKAKEAGLVEAARAELTDDELIRLISRPGFSTAERVTDISGRGVGIDAVQTRVRALGGSVEIRSVPRQGTTVTVRLPLTLAIVRALLARIGDELYAIPMTHVNETVELKTVRQQRVKGREVLVLREDVLPLVKMRQVMGLPEARVKSPQVIVLEMGERRSGLLVDELAGQQEIVVKQFDGVRGGLALFSGATILGDGAPALIVDVSSLI